MCEKWSKTIVGALVLALSLACIGQEMPAPVGWWTFDEGDGTVTADISGNGHDGTIVGATWAEGQDGSAALEFGGSAGVQIPPAVFDTITTQCSMTLWAFGADALGSVETVGFRAENSAGIRQWSTHMPWSNGQFYLDSPYQNSSNANRLQGAVAESLYKGSWQHWAFIKNADTGQMSVYNNGEIILGPSSGHTMAIADVVAFTIGNQIDLSVGWQGIMDDVRLFDVALTVEQIQATMLPPALGPAVGPNPSDGATDVLRDTVLSWGAGTYADKHEVYFGTSFEDVNTATTASEAYQGQQSLEDTSFDPGMLEFGMTYYWRIDEVNATNPESPWPGDVWSFEVEPTAILVAGDLLTATASSQNSADEPPDNT
ncbi:LamG-like jellyroll fold domain-containing protein, partial [Planctomycetota bacterium]